MTSWQSYAYGYGPRQSTAPSTHAGRQSMVRQSHAGGASRARESIYPLPSSDFLNALEECVQATEGCEATLSGAIQNFEPGVSDLPRLSKVFQNTHHFICFPANEVSARKAEYADSLQPQIDSLITRAGRLVDDEAHTIEQLEEHLAGLERARLPALPASARHNAALPLLDDDDATRNQLEGVDMKSLALAQRRKIGLLQRKRERLEEDRARYSA